MNMFLLFHKNHKNPIKKLITLFLNVTHNYFKVNLNYFTVKINGLKHSYYFV